MTQPENPGLTRRLLRAGGTAVKFGWNGVKFLPWLPTLVLLALVLFAIPILLSYSALTRETIVAEVIMSPMQSDEKGTYIEIEFTPYQLKSAWETALSGNDAPSEITPNTTLEYKVYGDTVAIRGPLIALHQGWRILNFDNIFKLALIEGEYRVPNANRSAEGSEFPINGGFDEFWWNVNAQEATFPYNTLIKRVTFSGDEEPGFVGANRKRYHIVITSNSITWNFIENVP
jgi:hypothetical protein